MRKKTLFFLIFVFSSCESVPPPPKNINGLWEWKRDSCIKMDNTKFENERQQDRYQLHIHENGEAQLYMFKQEVNFQSGGGKSYCDVVIKGRYERENLNTIKMNFTSSDSGTGYQVQTRECNQMPVKLEEADIPSRLLPYFKQKLELRQPADRKLIFVLPGVSHCKDRKMEALFHAFS